jgi:hypothetical protein
MIKTNKLYILKMRNDKENIIVKLSFDFALKIIELII